MPGDVDAAPAAAADRTALLAHEAPSRDLYIDRLRVAMTALVLLHHTAITYGGPGSWFYNELHPSGSLSSLLLTFFEATNQAYFMGFFFLLAGYFTPRSLDRKGYAQFLGDRFLRLGLPLVAFILVLGPLTVAMISTAEGHGFWSTFARLWKHGTIITGPMWFVQALLMFSLGYCVWRAWFCAPLAKAARVPRPVPAYRWWLLSAIGVGAFAFAIRQWVPAGVNVIGLQLGYFSSYIFLFAMGIAAWRYDWLRRLKWKHVLPSVIALVFAWPALPVAIAIADRLYGPGKSNFLGGFSWPAILYAFWEPFVAWGLIGAWLLVFREHLNKPSAIWSWLTRRAYAVYILHPPVLVGLTLVFQAWIAPALIKFAFIGALTCIATWLAADPFVRLPGMGRVV